MRSFDPTPARRRTVLGLSGFGLILAGIAVLLIILFLPAWFLMLVIGGLHSGWIAGIPTIGYGSAWVLTFGLSVVGGILRGASVNRD